MNRKNLCKEIINLNEFADFYRYFHEVKTHDGMKLLMTHKIPANQDPIAPIILVHGLGQNRYTWTQTRRSLENYLVSKGFETFNVELRGHGLSRANGSDYPTHFEKYIYYDIPALFNAIYEITNCKKMFYMGHSLGGAISYCVGPNFQEYLAGIISIAGPFRMGEGNNLLKWISKIGVSLDKLLQISNLHPPAFYIDLIGVLVKYGLFIFDSPNFKNFPIQVWYPK
ncbi:MAG: alpha/beta fold hydrolase, partial [Desulfobacterales bacterium]|nr:alpha/beta fold hydrolase [Desulfobacterales bacterium]